MLKWHMPIIYEETYKGFGFHITHARIVFFDTGMPVCGRDLMRRTWREMYSKEEREQLDDTTLSNEAIAKIVRKGIDNFINNYQ